MNHLEKWQNGLWVGVATVYHVDTARHMRDTLNEHTLDTYRVVTERQVTERTVAL